MGRLRNGDTPPSEVCPRLERGWDVCGWKGMSAVGWRKFFGRVSGLLFFLVCCGRIIVVASNVLISYGGVAQWESA